MDFGAIKVALEKRFGADFDIMQRAHYSISSFVAKNNGSETIIDVSDYPDSQELLAAADVMISDYSSIMWDFGVQRKPVFLI